MDGTRTSVIPAIRHEVDEFLMFVKMQERHTRFVDGVVSITLHGSDGQLTEFAVGITPLSVEGDDES
jgi:hypothetical protein